MYLDVSPLLFGELSIVTTTPLATATSPLQTTLGCVLVVDDEPAFCTVVGEILELSGYSTLKAYGVAQALEILRSATPDLILTDIMMPGSDGIGFIRRLRATPAWAHIPIIAISALTLPEDLREASENGADACMTKPFSAEDLRQAVRRYLG